MATLTVGFWSLVALFLLAYGWEYGWRKLWPFGAGWVALSCVFIVGTLI